ncbi:hypothetical protein BO86DRAFT_402460 [Aspergillus japonicus CBS 114.51]|uniref:C2H2-type domain-containing protein n=1 Tax=Aspergillus japonicus CBS 114.51 TaxID=1448312 RepID=A0A8T8WSK6_ASPJA|nr:hypothetical protein BO86DRAFT_402460 [Aspergillus japonicus CBS 114.51]RAH78781.1 hypothetical protein BO86DRAFT_402460 [Aspergillus japonicus CBS 114.51]
MPTTVSHNPDSAAFPQSGLPHQQQVVSFQPVPSPTPPGCAVCILSDKALRSHELYFCAKCKAMYHRPCLYALQQQQQESHQPSPAAALFRCRTCGIECDQPQEQDTRVPSPIATPSPPSAPATPGACRPFITTPYHYTRTPAGLYMCTYIYTAPDGTTRFCNLQFSAWPNYRSHHHRAHERAADVGHSCEICGVRSGISGARTTPATATAATVPVPVSVPALVPASAPATTLTDFLLAVEEESNEPPLHLLPPPLFPESKREVSIMAGPTPTNVGPIPIPIPIPAPAPAPSPQPTTPEDTKRPILEPACCYYYFKRTKEGHFTCTFPIPTRTRTGTLTTTTTTEPCGWRMETSQGYKKHFWRKHLREAEAGGSRSAISTSKSGGNNSTSTGAKAGRGTTTAEADPVPEPRRLKRRRRSSLSSTSCASLTSPVPPPSANPIQLELLLQSRQEYIPPPQPQPPPPPPRIRPPRPRFCPLCTRDFEKLGALVPHLEADHAAEIPVCLLCLGCHRDWWGLLLHLEEEHPEWDGLLGDPLALRLAWNSDRARPISTHFDAMM